MIQRIDWKLPEVEGEMQRMVGWEDGKMGKGGSNFVLYDSIYMIFWKRQNQY